MTHSMLSRQVAIIQSSRHGRGTDARKRRLETRLVKRGHRSSSAWRSIERLTIVYDIQERLQESITPSQISAKTERRLYLGE